MRHFRILIIGALVLGASATKSRLYAQADEVQAVRLAAAAQVRHSLGDLPGRRVLLDPAAAMGDNGSASTRSEIERKALARAVGVELATAGEGVKRKSSGQGYQDLPPRTTVINIGEPVFIQDTAKVTVSVTSGKERSANDPMANFVSGNQVGIYSYLMVRSGAGWKTVKTTVART